MANLACTLMFQMLRGLRSWLDVLCFTAALHNKQPTHYTTAALSLIHPVNIHFIFFNLGHLTKP